MGVIFLDTLSEHDVRDRNKGDQSLRSIGDRAESFVKSALSIEVDCQQGKRVLVLKSGVRVDSAYVDGTTPSTCTLQKFTLRYDQNGNIIAVIPQHRR